MQQSKELAAFYEAMWEWVYDLHSDFEGYAEIFWSNNGLCSNLYRYSKKMHPQKVEQLQDELEKQFVDAFQGTRVSIDFPFNATSREYEQERDKYLNPERLAWIKAHLPG